MWRYVLSEGKKLLNFATRGQSFRKISFLQKSWNLDLNNQGNNFKLIKKSNF